MPALQNYNRIKVQQRNVDTGCIPASIEWLLKFNKIDIGTSWNDFQEVVDCGKDKNDFKSVPQKIQGVYCYSKEEFISEPFEAEEKCKKIKELIDSGKGCIVPILIEDEVEVQDGEGNISQMQIPTNKFHISPAVEYNDNELVILLLEKSISEQRFPYTWEEIIRLHNAHHGGHDILWLKSCD